jgi:hypothetical protein
MCISSNICNINAWHLLKIFRHVNDPVVIRKCQSWYAFLPGKSRIEIDSTWSLLSRSEELPAQVQLLLRHHGRPARQSGRGGSSIQRPDTARGCSRDFGGHGSVVRRRERIGGQKLQTLSRSINSTVYLRFYRPHRGLKVVLVVVVVIVVLISVTLCEFQSHSSLFTKMLSDKFHYVIWVLFKWLSVLIISVLASGLELVLVSHVLYLFTLPALN